MPRRSRMEIYIDILKAVAEGRQKPTHVMYRANLTWTRLGEYLDFLVNRKLLTQEEINGSTTFSLTNTGKEVLGYYKRIEYQVHRRRKVVTSEVYALVH